MTIDIDPDKVLREHSQGTYPEGTICDVCRTATPHGRCLPYELAIIATRQAKALDRVKKLASRYAMMRTELSAGRVLDALKETNDDE